MNTRRPSDAGADGPRHDAAANECSHTDWSMIYAARTDEPQKAGQAMERIARRYWPAIYAFVRGTGRDVDEAADLTQGFICDVLLERGLLDAADPTLGRFRSLLLAALQNYLRQRHRDAARKRAGRTRSPSFVLDETGFTAMGTDARGTPEEFFTRQWAVALIRQVLEEVQTSCAIDGLEDHWRIFEQRVARPMLLGEPPTPYPVLLEAMGLPSVAQASNMLITIKRRFVRTLEREVGGTVLHRGQVEDEMLELIRALERS